MRSEKNHFQCSFIVQNPFQTNLRFENFFKFFFLKKHQFFSLFRTLYCKGEKHEVRKKIIFSALLQCKIHFSSIYDLRTFSIFFFKTSIFSLFRTLYCKVEKHEVTKKSFLVLFYSAKSNSDHVTTSNFSNFFQKIIFFTVLTPYTAQVRKVNSAKNHILVIFYSAKSISDHLTISELFQVFFYKTSIFFTVSNPILQS